MIRTAILAAIKRQRLSNHELARRSGVDRATVSRYVRGLNSVTDTTADKLLKALELSVKEK